MKTAFWRSHASLVLVASALFGLACSDTRTPTEPVNRVFEPTPTPAPAASLSGKVKWLYGDAIAAGLTVECQGRSTITSSDGTYSLTGLVSGKTTVDVGIPGQDGPDRFEVELKPGSNTLDLGIL